MKVNCRARAKQPEIGTSLVTKEKDENNLLMAITSSEVEPTSVWLVDNWCSNHMTCDKSLFSSLDESMKVSVRLDNDKEMNKV